MSPPHGLGAILEGRFDGWPLGNPQRSFRFKSPLAALAGSFALGILWARWFHSLIGIPVLLAVATTLILIGLMFLRADWGRAAVALVLASMTLTGAAAMLRWEQRMPHNHVQYLESLGVKLDAPVTLMGRVLSTPAPSGHGTQFDLEVERAETGTNSIKVQGKVRVRVQGFDDRLDSSGRPVRIQFGDIIRAVARLDPPHTYQDPGSFNFREWMEDIADLYWVGTVRSPRQTEILGHASRFDPATWVEASRQRLLRAIDDLYPPWSREGRNGAVLKAVLWGDRTALDSETIDGFRNTGLYHLLVIAGLHIGLITLLVDLLLRWLGLRRVTRALMTLSFLAIYALLVEQRAPTLRATLMIALYLFARILGRGHSPLNSLGGVALVLLYVRPAWLFESGFQLSFSAALLIVVVAIPILESTTEPYRRALRQIDNVMLDDYFPPRLAQLRLELRAVLRGLRRRIGIFRRFPALSTYVMVSPLRLVLWTVNILIFSAALQLGLILPMVEIFHRVTFAGVGLNALAIPVMTVLLALALPVNLLAAVSPTLAAWPAKLLSLAMSLLFHMTHLPRLAPWLSYRIPAPPIWAACGFCLAFVLAGVALRFARRWTGIALAACAVFVALVAIDPFPPQLPRDGFELTALDCGRGEALFAVLPGGATMLVNAGGGRAGISRTPDSRLRRWNAGEEIVSPYLWSRGIKRIDVLAVTHASPENFDGLQAILANFQVSEVWYDVGDESPGSAAFLDQVARRGIPTRLLIPGDHLNLGGASIRVMDPEQSGLSDSTALEINAGGHRFWLPDFGVVEAGDEPSESARPVENVSDRTAIGESNSRIFANNVPRLTPRVVILTSGPSFWGGRYPQIDDPAVSALAACARVFRVAADGATTVRWNKDSLEVRTFNNSERVESIGGE